MSLSRRVRRAHAVTGDDVIIMARVNYEQIIPEVARSAGYDSDDKGLDLADHERHGDRDTAVRGAQ